MYYCGLSVLLLIFTYFNFYLKIYIYLYFYYVQVILSDRLNVTHWVQLCAPEPGRCWALPWSNTPDINTGSKHSLLKTWLDSVTTEMN